MKWPRPDAIFLGVLVVQGALSAKAQEQNNSWCAYFSGGPVKCGFATFQGCLSAIRGKPSLCDRNSQDVQPAESRSSGGGHGEIATCVPKVNKKAAGIRPGGTGGSKREARDDLFDGGRSGVVGK